MKILILNASPRRDGMISQAACRFMEGVEESAAGDFSENVRIDVVNVSDLKFAACRGCMQCRKCGRCCLPEDDAHRVAEDVAPRMAALERADLTDRPAKRDNGHHGRSGAQGHTTRRCLAHL